MQDVKGLLDQFLGQAPGGAAAAPGQTQSDGGFDLGSLISGKGGLATGAVAGGLVGLLLGGKKPRKIAKSALKVGGAALVGGLAYKAWRDWQANTAPQAAPAPEALPAPSGTPFLPADTAEEESLSQALVRAMIAAAKADGHVSAEERRRISEQLGAIGMAAENQAFVEAELAKPLDIDAVASGAKGPEQAAEIYAASLLVIDPNGAAERGYLAMLAARLQLESGLVEHLHAGAEGLLEREAA